MKKNLLSILILSLLVVNLVLTSVMMFSVMSTNNKTASMVGQIASVLELDLSTASAGGEEEAFVSIEDTATYDIEDEMTIPLKTGADGESHFAIVSVTLSMNKKDKGYKAYGETIDTRVSLIKGEITEAFGSYTIEELRADENIVTEDILERIQKMFDSKFVYKISFRGKMLQ